MSEVLNLPRPGVTRTIHAMEEKGYLKKETAKHDGTCHLCDRYKSRKNDF